MLSSILARRPARSIDEVVAIMNAIDAALPDVRFFSQLDSFTGFAGRGLLVHRLTPAAREAGDTRHD